MSTGLWRLAAPVLLCVAGLAGCAPNYVRPWTHPTAGLEERQRDEYACQGEVRDAYRDAWVAGPVWFVAVQQKNLNAQMERYYEQCMAARGYHHP